MQKRTFRFIPLTALALIYFSLGCTTEPDTDPDFLVAKDILDEFYGTDTRQNMDIYLPAGRSTLETPVLVYIHGGGWIDGDKSEFLQVKLILENEFPNYAFISLNYRLFDFVTGKYGILDQEQDIISAFDYIESKLTEWNISNDFVISGASAGGHLALLHAYKNNTSNLKAAAVFFPPTDLIELYSFNNITSLGLTALLGGTPATANSKYLSASPLTHIDPSDVSTIFFHGDLDTVVPISQSKSLALRLQSENVRHKFRVVHGQGHGFTPQTYAILLKEAKEFVEEF